MGKYGLETFFPSTWPFNLHLSSEIYILFASKEKTTLRHPQQFSLNDIQEKALPFEALTRKSTSVLLLRGGRKTYSSVTRSLPLQTACLKWAAASWVSLQLKKETRMFALGLYCPAVSVTLRNTSDTNLSLAF